MRNEECNKVQEQHTKNYLHYEHLVIFGQQKTFQSFNETNYVRDLPRSIQSCVCFFEIFLISISLDGRQKKFHFKSISCSSLRIRCIVISIQRWRWPPSNSSLSHCVCAFFSAISFFLFSSPGLQFVPNEL